MPHRISVQQGRTNLWVRSECERSSKVAFAGINELDSPAKNRDVLPLLKESYLALEAIGQGNVIIIHACDVPALSHNAATIK
jgi:hypothetical protein